MFPQATILSLHLLLVVAVPSFKWCLWLPNILARTPLTCGQINNKLAVTFKVVSDSISLFCIGAWKGIPFSKYRARYFTFPTFNTPRVIYWGCFSCVLLIQQVSLCKFLFCLQPIWILSPRAFAFSFLSRIILYSLIHFWRGGLASLCVKIPLTLSSAIFFFLFFRISVLLIFLAFSNFS